MESYHIWVIRLRMRCYFASCKYIKLHKKILQVISIGVSNNRASLKLVKYGEYVAVEGGGVERDWKNSEVSERWRCKVEKGGGGGVESR